MHDLSTTLVAVATAPGRGGIGCVRLSGARAREIAAALFRPRAGSRVPRFGALLGTDGREVDHGFLVEFEPAKSFTGEASAELWAHGSPPVLHELVKAAVRHGAVPAHPGEFTYRAVRHRRIDLAGAEGVRDLIAATTLRQARAAFSQVEGATARRLEPLRAWLIDLLARGEAAVEFVEESEVHMARGALARDTARALSMARELIEEARRGRVLREGARVAICGAASVGKSSLFNRLLGVERAIVSPIPGTTRDTLEETVELDGLPVTIVDTAGLRAVEDPVEVEGVRRARAAAAEADLSILVLDASREPSSEEREAVAATAAPDARPCLIIVNKTDLGEGRGAPPSAIRLSVRTGTGWEDFRRALRDRVHRGGTIEDPALTSERHALALERAVAALARAEQAIREGLSEEAVLLDVREALDALGEISGEVGTEELYDRIFATFCIGK